MISKHPPPTFLKDITKQIYVNKDIYVFPPHSIGLRYYEGVPVTTDYETARTTGHAACYKYAARIFNNSFLISFYIKQASLLDRST